MGAKQKRRKNCESALCTTKYRNACLQLLDKEVIEWTVKTSPNKDLRSNEKCNSTSRPRVGSRLGPKVGSDLSAKMSAIGQFAATDVCKQICCECQILFRGSWWSKFVGRRSDLGGSAQSNCEFWRPAAWIRTLVDKWLDLEPNSAWRHKKIGFVHSCDNRSFSPDIVPLYTVDLYYRLQ